MAGFDGDKGSFSFGSNSSLSNQSNNQYSSNVNHSRRPSKHKRHSSVSTRRDSMQLMSGFNLSDIENVNDYNVNNKNDSNVDNNGGDDERVKALASLNGLNDNNNHKSVDNSLSKEDEKALEDGFVRGSDVIESSTPFLIMPTTEQIDQLSGRF